jgi:hypothetical protein
MKRAILLFASMIVAGFVQAQSNIEEVQMFQAKFGAEKKALVAEFIKLQSPAKETFWGLYDQYEKERKDLGLGRIDLLKKYADNYATLDDVKTNEIMKEMIDLMKKNDNLILSYYEKIKKSVGAKPAAQFFQLEGYFLSAIRVSILDEIPFIGELDAHEKK